MPLAKSLILNICFKNLGDQNAKIDIGNPLNRFIFRVLDSKNKEVPLTVWGKTTQCLWESNQYL